MDCCPVAQMISDDCLLVLQASARQPQSKRKMRLDELCAAQYPEHSPAALRSWIAQGKVQINGAAISKAGTPVLASSNIVITAVPQKFVCRQDLHLCARSLHQSKCSIQWSTLQSLYPSCQLSLLALFA